jgi:2-polyprenyl-6-methoxyphenol hydroxylase-like FAD-dependent oxidoreductase
LVIGGSVGGLFAAHLLQDIGWDVTVFERTAGDLGDRGTGIGTREELFAVMRRTGVATDASIGIGVEGRVGLGGDGRVSHELPVRAVTSAWSRIWRPLRHAWPYERYAGGKTLVGIEQSNENVSAMFSDGSRVEGDLLVGADGLHSAVRAQFLPELAPRYVGYVAWRGVVEADALSPELGALVLHRMVFGFPDGELMLSIPMPVANAMASRSRRHCSARSCSQRSSKMPPRGSRHSLQRSWTPPRRSSCSRFSSLNRLASASAAWRSSATRLSSPGPMWRPG